MPGELHCPLCAGVDLSPYTRDRRRPYLGCTTCNLVFVPAEWRLCRDDERAEYELHRNDPADPGYRTFLSRLAQPLVQRLEPGNRGLDFGCGPGPVLAEMLREAGFEVALYDSFFKPDKTVFDGRYDFICATEVVEHLHHPGRELARLWGLLRPRGWLGIMTKLVRDRAAFDTWHYKRDPTHVSFFSADSWHWWAAKHGATVEIIGVDVILLRRNG